MNTQPKPKIDLLLLSIVVLTAISAVMTFFLMRQKQEFLEMQSQSVLAKQIREQQAIFSKESKESIDMAFLNEEKVVEFIQILENVGNTLPAFKLDFKSDAPEGKKEKYLTFIVDASGSYQLVQGFIDKLLNSQWVIEVQSLELTSDDGFGGIVKSLLTGRLYVSEKFNNK